MSDDLDVKWDFLCRIMPLMRAAVERGEKPPPMWALDALCEQANEIESLRAALRDVWNTLSTSQLDRAIGIAQVALTRKVES